MDIVMKYEKANKNVGTIIMVHQVHVVSVQLHIQIFLLKQNLVRYHIKALNYALGHMILIHSMRKMCGLHTM